MTQSEDRRKVTKLFKEPQSHLFEESMEEVASGPVECLGESFSTTDERREHFLGLLEEKLQDPKYRATPGFPVGTDEAILQLSDPPYYTACPNPFLADAILESASVGEDCHSYRKEPLAIDISEGKSGPLYNAHTYHTKVPPAAILNYLLWYTKPGDVVWDAYAGSGMTAVAGRLCEELGHEKRRNLEDRWSQFSAEPPEWGPRTVVLSDLSPAASFIGYNYGVAQSKAAVLEDVSRAVASVEAELGWAYRTQHNGWPAGERDPSRWKNTEIKGQEGKIIATLWSEVFSCSQCAEEVVLWRDAIDAERAAIREPVTCPNCGAQQAKAAMDRATESAWDPLLKETRKTNKFVPVLIIYQHDKRRYEKVPDDKDLEVIDRTRRLEATSGPVRRMMDATGAWGAMYRAGYHRGVSHVHHFFTERNWVAIAALWDSVTTAGGRFALTSLMPRLSRMHALHLKNFFKGGGGFAAGNRKGQLYFPSLALELSPTAYFEDRARAATQGIPDSAVDSRCFVSVNSAEASPLPDGSVDYIFIDPPFGQNIIYSELNFLWEVWLGVATDSSREAIVDDFRSKSLESYRDMMRGGFDEAFRVLKPGRWMTVVFHNSSNAVWRCIQEALQLAGFVVGDVRVLDKRQASQKQVVAPGTVRSDLAITAYRPSEESQRAMELAAGSVECVWALVAEHLGHLPVFDGDGLGGQVLPERQAHMLFNRVLAYYVTQGRTVPIDAAEFYAGLRQKYPEREGMYFLPDQVPVFDRKRLAVGELRQSVLVVNDEASAIQWVRQQLHDKPQSFQDLQPAFMQQLGAWAKHEQVIELKELLEQNFFYYDGGGPVPSQVHRYLSTNFKSLRNLSKEDSALRAKARGRWYVPDPRKEEDLEKLRTKTLLKEFESYRASTKRVLKQFRSEAVRAGFKKAYDDREYQVIVDVASKLPEQVVQEDEKLLMYYDVASMRLGD